MPPILKFLIVRLLSVFITLLIITAILYGIVMLAPPEERATLYLPKGMRSDIKPEQIEAMIEKIVERRHLRDPYPVQYILWMGNLLKGDLGYSPALHDDVLAVLLRRTPVTAELALYSILAFIPLGIISGVLAAKNESKSSDDRFRLAAYTATSMPPFILALILLAVFYVTLHWFAPERLSIQNSLVIHEASFQTYTGLLTIDGLLNGRADISKDAALHLVLPVFTLSLVHWATLGRVTRSTMIEELRKEHILAAKGRGISTNRLVWKHAFRNILSTALSSSALSAASLVTGVYVVEVIYNFHGLSEIVIRSVLSVPDAPALLGFAIYSVIMVLAITFFLDIFQAIVDPRIREGVIS
ncbi:MAG: ABC transporter permease [Omnitrophica WOR_2 bacterium]